MKARITILSVLAILIATTSSYAFTSVSGGVVSGTWTKANSPYQINGSIMIPNDSTLTIEPGVVVQFQGAYEILVLGRLVSVGALGDTITYTASNTSTGWLGIRFKNTTSNNDTSKLYYCKFEYGKATLASPNDCGGAIYFNHFSKAIVSNSFFTNCSANKNGGGLFCNGSSPFISKNKISNNTAPNGAGIYCDSSSAPSIDSNLITNNTGTDFGSGIATLNSSSSITNNTITNNTNSNTGGGLYCEYGTVYIANNTISNNACTNFASSMSGGGIVSYNCKTTITNNTITYNSAAGFGGGGIGCGAGAVTITNNNISHNTASFSNAGGAIGCGSGNVTVANNTITYNTNSAYDGGAIFCGNSGTTVTISDNLISNNSAVGNGGGIICSSNSQAISGNVITNNTAANGGGIYCTGSNSTITNNTIANNSAQYGGALYCVSSSTPTLLNTILWGNTASTSGNQLYLADGTSDANFSYCDIQGGQAAFGLYSTAFFLGTYANNIDSIPDFVAPSGGSGTGFNGVTADWSLQGSSPCINIGKPSGTYPATDIAGNPRIVNSIIDIGAYEYQGLTGIKEYSVASSAASVYPNPASTECYVDITGLTEKGILQVTNLLGQEILSVPLNPQTERYTLNTSTWQQGVYILSVNGRLNRKLVVVR